MNKNLQRAAITFCITALLFLAFFWLGGFNYDERGHHVAIGFIISLAVTILASFVAYNIDHL